MKITSWVLWLSLGTETFGDQGIAHSIDVLVGLEVTKPVVKEFLFG